MHRFQNAFQLRFLFAAENHVNRKMQAWPNAKTSLKEKITREPLIKMLAEMLTLSSNLIKPSTIMPFTHFRFQLIYNIYQGQKGIYAVLLI